MSPLPAAYEVLEPIRRYIGQADIRINNLEMVLSKYDCYASTFCGGVWLTAPPTVLDDVCRFGFNYFSFANNHTMDYSYGGLESTLDALAVRGLPNSGAGGSLADASRHAVVRSLSGTAGILSITATADDARVPAAPAR